jgi:hypothetical protein
VIPPRPTSRRLRFGAVGNRSIDATGDAKTTDGDTCNHA